MTRWTSVAVSLVGLTALLVGPMPVLALIPLLMSGIHVALKRAIKLNTGSELMLELSLFALCVVVGVNIDLMPSPIGEAPILRGWATFGYGLLVIASLRLWVEGARGGTPATIGIALISMAVWGGKNTGWFYPLVIALFLGFAAFALRAADAGRPQLKLLSRRHVSQVFVALTLALTTATAAAVTLPPLHSWVVKRVMRGLPNKSGFSSFLWLGSMKGMLQSDRIVMRVRGAETNYLRGIVYVEYSHGAWTRRDADKQVRPVPRFLPPGNNVTEIEVVRDSPRYFTPLGTSELAASTGFVALDSGGIYEPVAGDPAKRLWLSVRPPVEGEKSPQTEAPTPLERSVPPSLLRPLQRLAVAWTRGTKTPKQQLEALALHLRSEYAYSLDFERPRRADPVLDFLFRGKQGHCEYFASALALLARSIGIPTRVVAGYSVSEYSEVGDYYLVRERNAHSWVEAWTGERWETYDATPSAEIFPTNRRTGWLPGVVDWFGATWSRFMDWLLERELSEVLSALGAAIALLFLVRFLRLRRKRADTLGRLLHDGVGPLPGWVALERALKESSLARSPTETPEAWGKRLSPALPGFGPELSQLAAEYSAFRYGAQGDAEELERRLRDLALRVTRAPRQRIAREP
ncbi:MAG: DUF4129 domain-containing protein [Polyangiaceae bacterium]|nr:DUF4129 domain-containing protein [Polyangiaceae bacterium]